MDRFSTCAGRRSSLIFSDRRAATTIVPYTIGSAHVNHLDASTGSLEVGKLADLVILDRNLRAPNAGPIGDARVRHTFVDGREVYPA